MREQSMNSMAGEQAPEETEAPDEAGGAGDMIQAASADETAVNLEKQLAKDADRERSFIKKRRLYRALSGNEVPSFPHDNDAALTGELTWEAGRPRWVFLGTPASGAGTMGFLEQGSSVVALCADSHHATNYRRVLRERAVEKMMEGSNVFKERRSNSSVFVRSETPRCS